MIGQITESIVAEVSKVMPCYSQLPLTNVAYPFAVVEETIGQTRPHFNANYIVDIWNNDLNDSYTWLDVLAFNLYDIAVLKSKVFFWGKWDIIQNVPTQEEGLTRKQIRLELKGFFA
jgi:hypothetical protein